MANGDLDVGSEIYMRWRPNPRAYFSLQTVWNVTERALAALPPQWEECRECGVSTMFVSATSVLALDTWVPVPAGALWEPPAPEMFYEGGMVSVMMLHSSERCSSHRRNSLLVLDK